CRAGGVGTHKPRQLSDKGYNPCLRDTAMPNIPLHFHTITELAALIQSRQISPVEVTQALLERIAQLDRRYKSYATVMTDHALEAAKVADRDISTGTY